MPRWKPSIQVNQLHDKKQNSKNECMTDSQFVLVPGEALPVKIFPIKGGVPLIPGLQEIKI